MKDASWFAGLCVSADVGAVAHAGSVVTRFLADRSGLTAELSKTMLRCGFTPVHDRSRVLTDVAVMLAGGGEAIADIDVLRHQAGALGPVASPPTVWRTLDETSSGTIGIANTSPPDSKLTPSGTDARAGGTRRRQQPGTRSGGDRRARGWHGTRRWQAGVLPSAMAGGG